MVKHKPSIEKQRRAAELAKQEEAIQPIPKETIKTAEVLEDFSLEDLEQIDAHHKNVGATVKGYGCITIINHNTCGRRIHLENAIWRALSCPQQVKLFLSGNRLIVTAVKHNGIAVRFDRTKDYEEAVKSYKGKIILYATETVKRLTAEWELQFDTNCCFTGGTFKKCTVSGADAIVISNEEVAEAEVPAETEAEASVDAEAEAANVAEDATSTDNTEE